MRSGVLLLACASLSACTSSGSSSSAPLPPGPSHADGQQLATAESAPSPAASAAPVGSASEAAPPKLEASRYAWLADGGSPEAVEPLESRFAPPPGFTRASVEKGTFGAFLRGLPLAASGTPVLAYDGRTILAADHANLAAVVSMDVGKSDLQQCADSAIRLHAEWRWTAGARDHDYRAASGSPMPFARYLGGERAIPVGPSLEWKTKAKKVEADHRVFRSWLDTVFMFANTGSLARDAKKIARSDLRPGDLFVIAGNPGHTVVVLDVARSKKGETRALLGQGYMPAQRFHVLRPSRHETWFALDEDGGVKTPFWPAPFGWNTLRRLD